MNSQPESKVLVHLAQSVPSFALAVVCIGRGGADVRTRAGAHAAAVSTLDIPSEIEPSALFDCIVLDDPDASTLTNASNLRALLGHLSPHGILVTALPADFQIQLPAAYEQVFTDLHLAMLRCEPLFDGLATYTFARDSYDPLAHAEALASANFPGRAASVLDWLEWCAPLKDEQRATIAVKKLSYFRRAAELTDPTRGQGLLFQAQKEFHIAVHQWPRRTRLYREHAAIWRHFGNDDYAARILRSVAHVYPDAETLSMIDACAPKKTVQPPNETLPEWTGARPAPRILVLGRQFADYGMDTLYDGLCQVIGHENVVEFPWKPMLHGLHREATVNYPCWFDYPSDPLSFEALQQQLRDGRFDAILFADFVELDKHDQIRTLLDNAPDLPVIVYDPWDDGSSSQAEAQAYLGGRAIGAYFKREMLACIDYGPNAHPLPFGYPDRHVPAEVSDRRNTDLFWAGKRLFGTRALYLDRLTELLNRPLDQKFPQDEYARALRDARIGLSFFGFGFDTVRYWELAANGCMLFAERPLIRIPFNFVEGQSAVFFDDLPELEEKLNRYLADPDLAIAIGKAGRQHFLRYHTTSARARQFLGAIEHLLPE